MRIYVMSVLVDDQAKALDFYTEKLGFIVRHTSGIVCAPVTREHARRLQLNPMVADNDAPLGTAFTVSVDVRHGLTTGISAEERSNTVRALANGNIGAAVALAFRRGGLRMPNEQELHACHASPR